jgi:hypothetical protein
MANIRPQRTCIFCGGKGLTYEHAFAAWLKPYLASTQTEYFAGDNDLYPSHVSHSVKKWSGTPYSRRLRIVCKTCNNGWMGKLQEAAKPLLVPLLNGSACVIGIAQLMTLSSWAAMSTMVSEYFVTPDKRAISQSDRGHLWLTGSPPESFKIWIGCYARFRWRGVWFRTGAAIGDEEELAAYSTNDRAPVPNTQTTTYIIGQLYIHVLSSPVRVLVEKTDLDPRAFVQIFPASRSNSVVVWPVPSISDVDAYQTSRAIFDELDRISRLLGH